VADFPTGAVTFLFTDIEGSTRLVKQLRGRWSDVLADHQRLLRAAFGKHGGHEIDTQGDSFFVAFARARDAVLAAADAQLTLEQHEWPEGVELRVRIGIHTGQAALTDGRYTGLAVHRAARIGASAYGGQVLVSQATQTLLEDEEEDLGVAFRDLGEQRLKDLDRPVRLYQIMAPGLRADFPSLAPGVEIVRRARRRRLIALGAVVVAVGVAGAIFATRSSSGRVVPPNAVGVIDPHGPKVALQVSVGVRPSGLAAGAGSVWVANDEDKTVSRIDAKTRRVVRTISLPQSPTGLAFGDGAVWVVHGYTGSVSRIDPAFATVKTLRVMHTFAGGGLAGTVAVSPEAVWTAWGNSTVVRLRPATARVLGTALAGRSPAAIAYGAGSFWVANLGDNSVSQMSPATGRQTTTFHVGRGPLAVAVGGGKVWVADGTDDSVTEIDPASGSAATIRVGDGPVAIAYGENAVWTANAKDGTISRIDPKTGRVRTLRVGNSPAGIVVAAGLVWVSVDAT
jgi:YVTN family beta-propeller protein